MRARGFSPPLRSGGGGSAHRAETEGAGQARNLSSVAAGKPPPPRYAWSPSPASQGGNVTAALLATLALAACATIEKPLQDTSLHVAFEQKSRREGFRRVAVVMEDYYYCSPLTRQVFRVPRGFETDFASIPYWASAVFNPIGDDAEPAVVHDWLYAVGEKGKRDEADAIFLNALETAHVPALQSKMMYEAVRAGGAANYGAPSEWRFVDPETEKPAKAPKKPATAVVTTLKSCDDLRGALPRLRLMSDLPHL